MKLTRVFFSVHMGQAFQGLRAIARDAKTKIDEDTTIIFVNRKLTAFKVLRGKDYLVYYKNPSGHPIPLDALRFLPAQFGGKEVEVRDMVLQSLRTKLNQGTKPKGVTPS